ncbi:ubiquitin-like protein Atg12, partial [Syncephalis pseudoplumigaleata]
VPVRFRAAGNAPILKENRFQINASHRFHTVAVFLRKELRLKPQDPLFLYINSVFAPAPDEVMSNLHKCFNVDGQLIINYSITPAWG